MYIIIWKYKVKAELQAEFEKKYSAPGSWAKLFKNSKGFIKTELLHEENLPHSYLTIDWWASPLAYNSFLTIWEGEYANLDAEC